MTTQRILNFTNERLNNWYANAKIDYNVDGFGTAKIEDNKVIVNYTENGESKVWSMAFYPEYISNGIDWVFNCWMELA